MDILEHSWGAFSAERASHYLRTYGSPSLSSREIVGDLLKKYAASQTISILDIGCGNAQLYGYFKSRGIRCRYTGVDFSEPLLQAARLTCAGDAVVELLKDDVNALSRVTGTYDWAVYSHVIEMIASPERSLLKARVLAKGIIIRFFEPPDFDVDTVELREMDVGDEKKVPYLRRMMSRDLYRLILTKMGCTAVDVYRDVASKDQVHVLHY